MWRPVKAGSAQVLLLIGDEAEVPWQQAGDGDRATGGFLVHRARSLAEAVRFLDEQTVGAVACDLDLPDCNGADAVTRLIGIAPALAVVVLSRRDDENLALDAMERGAEDFLVKAESSADVLTRRLHLALARKRHELAFASTVLRAALRDALTRTPTRAMLTASWPQIVARSQRRHIGIAVLMVDLDDFKAINDTYGHVTGDQVLVTVARRLRDSIRRSDHLVRYGGDEFVIVAEEIATSDDLKRIIGSIRQRLGKPVVTDRHSIAISASIGEVIAIPTHSDTWSLQALIRRADASMYARKRARKQAQAARRP